MQKFTKFFRENNTLARKSLLNWIEQLSTAIQTMRYMFAEYREHSLHEKIGDFRNPLRVNAKANS